MDIPNMLGSGLLLLICGGGNSGGGGMLQLLTYGKEEQERTVPTNTINNIFITEYKSFFKLFKKN